MMQKEQSDHRQATREDYLEVKEVYLLTSHSVGNVQAIASAPLYGVFPSII